MGRMYVTYILIQTFLSILPQDIPEYTLTNEFCRKHFLIGVLLREVGFALQEDQDIRHLALAVLKNLMAKHSFDDRYAEPVKKLPVLSHCSLMQHLNIHGTSLATAMYFVLS